MRPGCRRARFRTDGRQIGRHGRRRARAARPDGGAPRRVPIAATATSPAGEPSFRRGAMTWITGPISEPSRLARAERLTSSGMPCAGELDDLGGAADRHVAFVAVPDRDQHVAVLDDEQADRAILLGALLGIAAHRFERIPVREGDDRGGDGLRQQCIEFGGVARLRAPARSPGHIPRAASAGARSAARPAPAPPAPPGGRRLPRARTGR